MLLVETRPPVNDLPCTLATHAAQCSLSLDTASHYDIIPTSTIDDFFRDHGLEHVDILKVSGELVGSGSGERGSATPRLQMEGCAHVIKSCCTFLTPRTPCRWTPRGTTRR